MGMIVMVVFSSLLWLLVGWGRIDRWSPQRGALVGWSLLGIALFMQFFWVALVIESWWYGGPPQGESGLTHSLVTAISFAIGMGRKTGWLAVGVTGAICLVYTRRLAAPGRWLIRSAALISTFALLGMVLAQFPLNAWLASLLWSAPDVQEVHIRVQQIVLSILLLSVCFVALMRVQPKER